MKRLLLVSLMFLVIAFQNSAESQTLQQSTTRIFVSFAFEAITISTVAIGFTSSVIAPSTNTSIRADLAEYSLEGCQIRYRISGGNPTSTVGTLMTTGSGKIYGWDNINAIRFIRDTSCSSDSTLSVHYYR